MENKICGFNGCKEKYYAKGFCRKHYTQNYYGITLHKVTKFSFICDFPNCNRMSYAKGYCKSHYYQSLNQISLKPIKRYFGKKCKVKNCKLKAIAKGYCSKHYSKLQIYGKPNYDKIRENILNKLIKR